MRLIYKHIRAVVTSLDFPDHPAIHLGYLGKTYFVDQDGVEPSPVLYKSTVLTVELQIHFIQNYIKFLPYLDGLVDLPRIELGSWQCECHILPLNHRPNIRFHKFDI